MLKKLSVLFVFIIIFSCMSTGANPVIINDLGGMYLNKNVTEIEMRHANKVVDDYSIKEVAKTEAEDAKSGGKNIITEQSDSEYTFKKGKMDVSQDDNNGIEIKGVNNSKTIYTDDLGRLHFFGKGSVVRE